MGPELGSEPGEELVDGLRVPRLAGQLGLGPHSQRHLLPSLRLVGLEGGIQDELVFDLPLALADRC